MSVTAAAALPVGSNLKPGYRLRDRAPDALRRRAAKVRPHWGHVAGAAPKLSVHPYPPRLSRWMQVRYTEIGLACAVAAKQRAVSPKCT